MDLKENQKPWTHAMVFPAILVCPKCSVARRGIACSKARLCTLIPTAKLLSSAHLGPLQSLRHLGSGDSDRGRHEIPWKRAVNHKEVRHSVRVSKATRATALQPQLLVLIDTKAIKWLISWVVPPVRGGARLQYWAPFLSCGGSRTALCSWAFFFFYVMSPLRGEVCPSVGFMVVSTGVICSFEAPKGWKWPVSVTGSAGLGVFVLVRDF